MSLQKKNQGKLLNSTVYRSSLAQAQGIPGLKVKITGHCKKRLILPKKGKKK